MSIIDKARELGEEIASSVELEEMKQSEMAMMNDIGARQLVEEFNEKQRKFLDIKSKGEHLSGEQIRDAEDLEKRVMENSLIVDFFRKQQSFEHVIEEINNIISRAITGECGDGACSDDCCSSCGGGCGV